MKKQIVKYRKLYTIKWVSNFSERDKCQYEGWSAFMGDICPISIFPIPFSTITKCKIAVDLLERCHKDMKMLEVDPKNYNEVWGKYISPTELRKLARRK